MKRDKNLIRELLLQIEDSNCPTGHNFESRFEPYSATGKGIFLFSLHGTEARPELRSRDYQLLMMEKAGVVEFVEDQRGNDFYGGLVRLTPLGHDAVEAISDETVWKKMMNSAPNEAYDILKSGGSGRAIEALFGLLGLG